MRLSDMSDAWHRLSLSARRAWIEICGGVFARPLEVWSLSARRAWIEIKYVVKDSDFSGVALRKESVDRNFTKNAPWMAECRRSPQGERG